jgi:hypothetical protein
MSLKVESKVQIDTFDQIFTQANLGCFYDYESKKLDQINLLERVIRALLSCTGLVESTVAKCIRVSSESLLQAIRTPNDPFITDKLRELIEKLEDVTDPKLIALIEKINKQAPYLIQNCLKAFREMKAELMDEQAATKALEKPLSADSSKKSGINQREKDLDIREEGLDKREEELDIREEGLDKRETAVTKREEDVTVRETNVQVREDAVGVKETAVQRRESDVASKEQAVKKQEKAVVDRANAVKKREDAVKAKEEELAELAADPDFAAILAAHRAKKAAAAQAQASKVVVNSPVGPQNPTGKPIEVHS